MNSGAAKTGKRFAFCQNEYILRTSGTVEVVHMENNAKGTRYDGRNSRRYCRYCCNNYQYYCNNYQYHANCKET